MLSTNGIVMDLSNYSNFMASLNNDKLLEGIKNTSLSMNNEVFGIPFYSSYHGFIINTPLFIKHNIPVPSADWDIFDYYDLVNNVDEKRNATGEDIRIRAEFGNYTNEVHRLSRALFFIPYFAGYSSSTGNLVKIDTPEMIKYMEYGKKIYEMFPFYDWSLVSSSDGSASVNDLYPIIYNKNMFIWPIDISDLSSSEVKNIIDDDNIYDVLPFPLDMHGNTTYRGDWQYICVYSKSFNKDDAVLFLTEFLNETFHRNEATRLQLFKDASKYDKFTDVGSGDWFYPYIASAIKAGLADEGGLGNGRFGPNDPLTYNQTLAMLVRVLQYWPMAESWGGWPNGYIRAAEEIGLTENTTSTANTPVTRSTVAILMYNAWFNIDTFNGDPGN